MTLLKSSLELSLIVLTWNSEAYIKRCLDSIVSALSDSLISYEVLIVDNGSTDITQYILREFEKQFPDRVSLYFLTHNSGTTVSRNLAIRKAKGEFVCILDSDVEVIQGTINHLMTSLKKNPLIALTVPKLVYPNGRHQKTTDAFPTIFRKIFRYFFLRVIEAKEEKSGVLDTSFEVDYAISAFWVLKRDIFTKIGLFDENIFYSPEDVDFCLRIWQAGYRVVYIPSVTSIHHTQEISRGFRINRAFLYHLEGLAYYFKKHKYFIKPPVFIKSAKGIF
jgi:GT2 family glycosyltransferase